MDAQRFDDLTRTLAGTPSRRGLLRAALAAAAGLLGQAALGDEAAAATKCRNDGGCSGCRRCDRRKGRCVAGCPRGKRCCGGACVDPKLCCATTDDCNGCATCVDGRCRPDPAKNGQTCSGCLTCANGACGVPDDARCADGEICRPSTGICCPECVDGRCCGVGNQCINPGPFSANFCCNTELNQPCGSNGDGTFRQCCSKANEECVGGECVPKGECPGGQPRCGDACCDARTERCHEGQCRDRCSLNATYNQRCDEGGDYWCCPERSPVCCRTSSGDPHCCPA